MHHFRHEMDQVSTISCLVHLDASAGIPSLEFQLPDDLDDFAVEFGWE